MPKVTLGTITLEAFPRTDGLIQVALTSTAGQQELTITLAEWTSLKNVEVSLVVAGEHIAKLRAEVAELRARQGAFVEAARASSNERYFVRYEYGDRIYRDGPYDWNKAVTHRAEVATRLKNAVLFDIEEVVTNG